MKTLRRIGSAMALGCLLSFSGYAAERQIQTGEIERIKLVSNNNIPEKVVVVSSSRTRRFVQDLIKTIQEINSQFDEKVKVHVICDSRYAASSLQKELESQGLYKTLVEINDQFFTADQWMQDWGEIAWSKIQGEDGMHMTIVDSNRGRGLAGLPKILADMWDAHYIKNPSESGIKGDYGGNIEVTPDNVLVIGTTSTKQMRGLLSDHGYKNRMAILDTHWLQVGHVDEYVSFIPNENAPGGYTIVKADPALALELIKNATDADLQTVHPDYRSQVRNIREALNSGMRGVAGDYDLTDVENMLIAAGRDSSPERLNQLVDLNQRISKLIDEQIETLKKEITRVTNGKHTEFDVVTFPTLFQGSSWSGNLRGCVALLPGVVNMLVLRNHGVIPDPQFGIYSKFIEKCCWRKRD
jgi:hypothetical protein